MSQPIFSTKLCRFDLISSVFYISIGIAPLFFLRNISSVKLWRENVFLFLILFLFVIQGVRHAKIFVLYSDKIIVRRPFIYFTRIFDVVYKFDELKTITFRTVKAKGTNDFVIFETVISTYKTGESYIFNDRNQIKILMNEIESLNFKSINELD